jgi:hypothetical protein
MCITNADFFLTNSSSRFNCQYPPGMRYEGVALLDSLASSLRNSHSPQPYEAILLPHPFNSHSLSTNPLNQTRCNGTETSHRFLLIQQHAVTWKDRYASEWSASVDESGERAGVTYSIATESFEKTSATMMMRWSPCAALSPRSIGPATPHVSRLGIPGPPPVQLAPAMSRLRRVHTVPHGSTPA